jgi:adenosylmethionine-8-amino-7-oxononanoate aminotransferase
VPIITRGEGWRIWDDRGNEYIDGLAGLFVTNVGHGRAEIAEAMAAQAKRARVLPAVVLRPPAGHRARRAPGAPRPG